MGKRHSDSVPYVSPHKCPKHNQWKRKGVCELCCLEEEALQRERELLGGKHKPEVKIGKL